MSTLKVAAINNPSASSGGLAISASGNVTGAGLDLITTQSFSAVSSVSVNNCWSAMYDNYVVLHRLTSVSATDCGIRMRLRVSGVDSSGSNYGYQQVFSYSTTVGANSDVDGQTIWNVGNASSVSPEYVAATINVYGPFVARPTLFTALEHNYTSTIRYPIFGSGYHNLSTAYDGFTLFPSTGTFTGSVSVYGYRK